MLFKAFDRDSGKFGIKRLFDLDNHPLSAITITGAILSAPFVVLLIVWIARFVGQ